MVRKQHGINGELQRCSDRDVACYVSAGGGKTLQAASLQKPSNSEILGWETGIEPATVGATVRCSAS